MKRRRFLQSLAAGLAAQFKRVWSFPTNIVIPKYPIHQFAPIYYGREARERLRDRPIFYEVVGIPEPPGRPPGFLHIPKCWVQTEGELLELLEWVKKLEPSPLGQPRVRAIYCEDFESNSIYPGPFLSARYQQRPLHVINNGVATGETAEEVEPELRLVGWTEPSPSRFVTPRPHHYSLENEVQVVNPSTLTAEQWLSSHKKHWPPRYD